MDKVEHAKELLKANKISYAEIYLTSDGGIQIERYGTAACTKERLISAGFVNVGVEADYMGEEPYTLARFDLPGDTPASKEALILWVSTGKNKPFWTFSRVCEDMDTVRHVTRYCMFFMRVDEWQYDETMASWYSAGHMEQRSYSLKAQRITIDFMSNYQQDSE